MLEMSLIFSMCKQKHSLSRRIQFEACEYHCAQQHRCMTSERISERWWGSSRFKCSNAEIVLALFFHSEKGQAVRGLSAHV